MHGVRVGWRTCLSENRGCSYVSTSGAQTSLADTSESYTSQGYHKVVDEDKTNPHS